MADLKGATLAQIALVPIPGTRSISRLDENLGAANVALTAEEMRDLDAAPANAPVRQPRLSEAHMSFIDR